MNDFSVYVPCGILFATLQRWHQYERFCQKVIAKLRIKIRRRWTEREKTEWLLLLSDWMFYRWNEKGKNSKCAEFSETGGR